MQLIQWDAGISVGVEEIDNDHRQLIGLVNQFSRAREEGRSITELGGLLNKLKTYSYEHFEREEAFMLENGYKGYHEHREQHLRFIAQVEAFEREFQMDKEFLAIKMMPFMMNWLIDHIMTSDKALAVLKRQVS